MNERLLITGAAGFIGSNLCAHFLDSGYEVVGLDNFATGRRENIKSLSKIKSFQFIEGDIRYFNTCMAAVQHCDIVLHQAALGSVPRSINDPLTTNEVNVTGFLNMLKASAEVHVKRFIYAASSSTYGDSQDLPKVEHNIGAPLSPYAVTKLVNELYANVFFKTYGLNTIGLRYFNVFGRHQDPNGAYAAVIPKFVKQFMSHQPITINGDGNYSRDFTYIDNVIHGNALALATQDSEALNQVYNVACGARTTIGDLAKNIRSNLVRFDPSIENVPITYGPKRVGDVPHSLASIQKAKNLLGYEPQIDVQTGLKRSIQWYWENL